MYDEDDFLPPLDMSQNNPEPSPPKKKTAPRRQVHETTSETTQENPSVVVTSFDKLAFDWLDSLLFAITILFIFSTFLGMTTVVSGHSMDPTLFDGELLFVLSAGYTPEAGDIVIINKNTVEYLNGVSIVKRVIATEGQHVSIDYGENIVYVDGIPLDEPYILERMKPYSESSNFISETTVPEGSIYVLGDNRNHSADSRYTPIGTIDTGYVLGKAVFSFWPLSNFRIL